MKTTIQTRPNAIFTTLLLGFGAVASSVAADLHVPTGFPTIQAAVNEAERDDTIHIAPGVYTEQVKIVSKKLSLIGQPGAILRATESLPVISGNPAPQWTLMFIQGSEVTVRSLTFEGERLAEHFAGPGELKAMFLRESSANLENCAFYGFRESSPGAEDATAVTATGFGDGVVNVRVANCTFADNYNGMFFIGSPNRKSMSISIENNTIIGPGALNRGWNFWGMFIREGVGGRIVGNTISGHSYTGSEAEFDISFGILASHQSNYPHFGVIEPLVIEGNTFRNNQMHISLGKANDSIVRDNRFQGSGPGILPLGLAVSGTNVTIANNQFEDLPEGIRLLGQHPLQDPLPNLGDILGFAINAQVTSNRFCNVSIPINRQAPASAAEVSTALGACASRPLSIAPAVLLSWPGDEDGWTLEIATHPEGPWNTSDATPFRQAGRHNAAVPLNQSALFFRLR